MSKLKRELLRKRKNKFKNEALRKWRPILKEYDLRTGDKFLDYPAEQYGWAKAERGLLGFIANFMFGNPLQQVLIALSIVLAIVSYGATTWLTWVIISASVASYTINTAYQQQIYLKQMAAWRNKAAAYATKSIGDAEDERGRQSDTINEDIIHGGYAIYANGAIYKDQFAGFNSNHSSQIAPDAAKGQFGTYKGSFIDDKLQNRSQVELAGGTSFMPKMLNTGFPLAKGMDGEDMLTLTKEMYIARSLKSIKGFNELVKNEFGLNTHNNFLKDAYDTIKERTMTPFEVNLTQLDFLDKNKAYNRGMIRDFDTLILSDFKENDAGVDKNKEITQEVEDFYNYYKRFQTRSTDIIPLETKARMYVDNVEVLFARILNGEFYNIASIDTHTPLDEIFKAQGIQGARGALVSVDEVKIIFKRAKEVFTTLKELENYVLSIISQSANYKCVGVDSAGYVFGEMANLRLSIFDTQYKHFVFYNDTKDLRILQQFKQGIPKDNQLSDAYLAKFYEGVG